MVHIGKDINTVMKVMESLLEIRLGSSKSRHRED